MSDALIIAIVATSIAALIVGMVTWMLVSPGSGRNGNGRIQPQGEPPDGLAALLAGHGEEGTAWRVGPADAGRLQTELAEQLERGEREPAVHRARVLRALGEETTESRPLALEPSPELAAPRPLAEAEWIERLYAPRQDRLLTGMMSLLGGEVIAWHAHPAEEYGLSRRQRVEGHSEQPRLAELARILATTLGVVPPVVFLTPDREARLMHINLAVNGTSQAALAAGREALALDDEAVLRFMLARKLSFMRAEHLVCTVVDDPEDLWGLYLATSRVLRPGSAPDPPDRVCGLSLDEAQARLRQLFGQADRAELMRRLLRAGEERAGREHWQRWLAACEQTSFRVGLLLAGDLRAALTILEQPDVREGMLQDRAQSLEELYGFYLSDDYDHLWRGLMG